MSALTRADLEGILGFVADAGAVEFDRPYPPELLARLAGLVRRRHHCRDRRQGGA
jgi:hypothetical protein